MPQRAAALSLGFALAALLLSAPLHAQATQPAEPAGEKRGANEWLTRIDQRADQLQTLKAKLRYDRIKGLLGSRQRRFGTLTYKAGQPPRFAVHFDRLIEDGQLREQDRWYIFDGRWLAEKRIDERIFIRRELVPKGKQRDVLQMGGQGPFVLPLDQDKAYLLKRFDVNVVRDESSDDQALKNTVHLRLTPKPNRDIDLTQVDLWYDRDTLLPQRAVTIKGEEGAQNKSIVTLLEVNLDATLAGDAFDTTPPDDDNWDVQIKRLQNEAPSGD
jgi:hypothetical protein